MLRIVAVIMLYKYTVNKILIRSFVKKIPRPYYLPQVNMIYLYMPFQCVKWDFGFGCYITIVLFTDANILISTLISYSDFSQTFYFAIILKFMIINVCTVCAHKYGNWFCLKQHHMLHTREKPYQCAVCKDKIVPTHITDSTTDKRPQKIFAISMFVCIDSDLKYEQWCYYKAHQTLHTGENPFHWHECNF